MNVIISEPDVAVALGGDTVVTDSAVLQCLVSDVATPTKGDTFTVAGVVYTVRGVPQRDISRLIWTMEAPNPS